MVKFKNFMSRYSLFLILISLIILFSCFSPYFLTWENIFNLIKQNTYFVIAAVGLSFVMIGGGIDLSVGYQMSLVGVVVAMLMVNYNMPVWGAVLVGLVLGTILGVINGLVVTRIKVFPLIATMATSTVFQGISYSISQAKTFRQFPDSFRILCRGSILGVQYDIILAIIIVFIAHYIFKKTYFGRYILAVGGNEEAARLAGIKAKKIRVIVYGICGFIFAIATMDMIAMANTTNSGFGPGTEFTCMTAAIIGGISFKGGKGSMIGLVVGVFIVQMLGNGMQLAGWGTYSQYIVKGIILLLAVAFDGMKNGNIKKVVKSDSTKPDKVVSESY